MDNDSLEADRATRNSHLECSKRASPDFDSVMIRAAVHVSVADVLPSCKSAPTHTSSGFTDGSSRSHFLERIVDGERCRLLTRRKLLESLGELYRERRSRKCHVALG